MSLKNYIVDDDPEEFDLPVVDILAERDKKSRTWRRALDLSDDDISAGDDNGRFFLDGALIAMAVDEDGDEWYGRCDCSSDPPCRHLCALAQRDYIGDVSLPEVSR